MTDVSTEDIVVVQWLVNNMSLSENSPVLTYAEKSGHHGMHKLSIDGQYAPSVNTIRCIATGIVNNEDYNDTAWRILYIQGI